MRVIRSAALLAFAWLGILATGANAAEPTAVTIPGNPMTVYVGPLGQCQSSYTIHGELAGNYYYGGNPIGDCGFFLAFPKEGGGKFTGQPKPLSETTWGFSGTAGPHLATEYTPVSQSAVSGSGTTAEPFTQTTVFEVKDGEGGKDALITETTTYVNGQPRFTSTYNVKNTSSSKLYFRAIYAGDLYVNGNDHGTGLFLAGPPRFIGGQNTGSGIVGGFEEAPAPALPWSSFQEAYWSEPFGMEGIAIGDNGIWHDVESTVQEPKAFNESIEPMELDNGAGVEWDQLRETGLEKGAEQAFTIINRTGIPSGLQISPANQTLTQGQTETVNVTALNTAGEPYAGKSVLYAASGANPQSGAVTLDAAGQAQISYVGHNPGIDTIQLYVDLAGTKTQTQNDPAGTATVTFVPLPPAPNSSYTVQSIHANPNGTVTIVFVPTQSGTATLEVTVPTGTIARREATAARRRAKKCKKGQSRIKGHCRPTLTTVGKTTAPGTAGVPLTLTVKPSGKVVSALKKGKTVHLSATLTYTTSVPGGTPTVQHFTVTVRPPKHKHHR